MPMPMPMQLTSEEERHIAYRREIQPRPAANDAVDIGFLLTKCLGNLTKPQVLLVMDALAEREKDLQLIAVAPPHPRTPIHELLP